MSSLKMEHVIIEAISNGACDYLQKPFTKQQLLTTIDKVFSELGKVDEFSL